MALLAEEVIAGIVDAAIVTLPLKHPDLQIEEIRQDRLVVCLRKDNPLARKSAFEGRGSAGQSFSALPPAAPS
jgi:DNA-binding transcriptional LysR family regulator